MPAPTDPPTRWKRVAPSFTDVAERVSDGGWERPAPCEGWVARDIVRHLAGWVPGFLQAGAAIELEPGPSVDDDPLGAWRSLADQVERLLTPPHAGARFSHPQAGDHELGIAIDRFVTGDVLIHTWDLAVATGQRPDLDDELVRDAIAEIEPITDLLVASGHYDAPVPVRDDADPVTRLVALTGRDPDWASPH